ncbi:MAG: lipoate--protein ligase [Bacteroidales bacterium]|nr:lipoate--protein ligase [Bacteroidales bacterium]
MLLIKSGSKDAYFNIALEEYLINNFDEEFFIIAVNEPSILIGTNQNTYDEINALYVKQNNLKVVRRLSGGGTVFQDYGNINFSHIYFDDGSKLNDFSKVCEIILNFVNQKLGLEASFAGRNDMIVKDKKFSGHARLKINKKILHHGTLLISSNMKSLTDALKFNVEKYNDRALRSNHERITNLSEHIDPAPSVENVFEMFWDYLRSFFPESKVYQISAENIEGVNKLVSEKYSTWDWNFGCEINLPLYNIGSAKYGNYEIYLQAEDDKIKQIRIFGDFFSKQNISDIENALIDCEINSKAVTKALLNIDFNNYMSGISLEDFVAVFDESLDLKNRQLQNNEAK